MRPLAAILIVVACLAPAPSGAQRPTPMTPAPTPPDGLGSWEQFDIWITAIEQHEIGRRDAALASVLALPADDLEPLFSYMVFTLRGAFAREQRAARFDQLFDGDRIRQPLQPQRGDPMIDRVARVGVDKFVKRAAMLHTDLAVVAPDSQRSIRAGTSQNVSDGRGVGSEGRIWHWMLARAFLHLVSKADQDAGVRLWYQVAASYLWSTRQFTEALPHIKRAIQIFPADAEVQFVLGLIHEAQGAPHIQTAVAQQIALLSLSSRRLFIPPVKSADAENESAREAFQQAVEIDPGHTQARIRLARLLVLDGKAARAATELRRALEQTSSNTQRYFAQLFLGRANEALGRLDDARAAYEAAAAAFPGAQSPRLALSQLGLQTGDRARAQEVFTFLSTPPGLYADPWWNYHYQRDPDPAVLLTRLHAAFQEATR